LHPGRPMLANDEVHFDVAGFGGAVISKFNVEHASAALARRTKPKK
jgi:hypothetical protein